MWGCFPPWKQRGVRVSEEGRRDGAHWGWEGGGGYLFIFFGAEMPTKKISSFGKKYAYCEGT